MPSPKSAGHHSTTITPQSIITFGEVLFDTFPDGRSILGGAPFNVSWCLQGLGHHPFLVSGIGDDKSGQEIISRMRAWNLDTNGIQISDTYDTGKVTVSIQDDEPTYEIPQPQAWDKIKDSGQSASQIFYHGSLALRSELSHNTFKQIQYRSSANNAKRFFDVNLRAPFYCLKTLKELIQNVDWLKLNLDELAIFSSDKQITFDNAITHIDALRQTYSIDNILLTAGSEGAIIRGSYGDAVISPAPEVSNFVDTVGAGDSFTAVTIHGILKNLPANQIITQAAQFAAKVCGIKGATHTEKDFYTTA